MAEIKVSSMALRDTSNSFKEKSRSIKGFMDNMTNEIDGVNSYYEGEAADALVKRFRELAPKFEEITNTINKYGDFLSDAADAYEKIENEIKAAADGKE